MKKESKLNDPNIPQAFEEYLLEQKLDGRQLDTLLGMQKGFEPKEDVRQPKGNKPYAAWAAGMAAALCIMVSLVFTVQWSIQRNYMEAIAGEVVKNHLKLKPLEVQASSIDGLRSYFTELDFYLTKLSVEAIQRNAQSMQLLGGRYCSIQGVTAAQLRFQLAGDSKAPPNVGTLYEVVYHPKSHGNIPVLSDGGMPEVLKLKGFDVSLWRENNILFVFVAGADSLMR